VVSGRKLATRAFDRIGLERTGTVRTWLNQTYESRFGPTQRDLAPTFTSYSQFGEDAFLDHLLHGRTGRYVDVGAGHPIQGSNTFALYERGWSGVLIDPLSENIELARQERPRDRVIEACCGSESGTTQLLTYSTSVYSTTHEERKDLLGEPEEVRTVDVITLRSLGLEAQATEIVLLNIDVEGDETKVLDGNDWETFRPALVILEEWDGPLGKPTKLMDRMNGLGYDLIGVLGYSSVYRHRDWDK